MKLEIPAFRLGPFRRSLVLLHLRSCFFLGRESTCAENKFCNKGTASAGPKKSRKKARLQPLKDAFRLLKESTQPAVRRKRPQSPLADIAGPIQIGSRFLMQRIRCLTERAVETPQIRTNRRLCSKRRSVGDGAPFQGAAGSTGIDRSSVARRDSKHTPPLSPQVSRISSSPLRIQVGEA